MFHHLLRSHFLFKLEEIVVSSRFSLVATMENCMRMHAFFGKAAAKKEGGDDASRSVDSRSRSRSISRSVRGGCCEVTDSEAGEDVGLARLCKTPQDVRQLIRGISFVKKHFFFLQQHVCVFFATASCQWFCCCS